MIGDNGPLSQFDSVPEPQAKRTRRLHPGAAVGTIVQASGTGLNKAGAFLSTALLELDRASALVMGAATLAGTYQWSHYGFSSTVLLRGVPLGIPATIVLLLLASRTARFRAANRKEASAGRTIGVVLMALLMLAVVGAVWVKLPDYVPGLMLCIFVLMLFPDLFAAAHAEREKARKVREVNELVTAQLGALSDLMQRIDPVINWFNGMQAEMVTVLGDAKDASANTASALARAVTLKDEAQREIDEAVHRGEAARVQDARASAGVEHTELLNLRQEVHRLRPLATRAAALEAQLQQASEQSVNPTAPTPPPTPFWRDQPPAPPTDASRTTIVQSEV